MASTPEEVEAQIGRAEEKRLAGNEAFKNGDLKGALSHYYSVLLLLKGLDNRIKTAFPSAPRAHVGPSAPVASTSESKISEIVENGSEVNDEKHVNGKADKAPATESDEPDRVAAVNKTIGQTYSNMAACHIKLQNWKKALEFSLNALKINEDDSKAKFREATARIQLGELSAGRKILEDLQKKGDDAAIRNALKQLEIDERARDAKSKAQFRGMFSKATPKADDPPTIGSKEALASAAAPSGPSASPSAYGSGSGSKPPHAPSASASGSGSGSTPRKTADVKGKGK